ncbi:MAG TPA: hypothetical protein VFT29_07525 [Gemmatimonadaceae bacterium]|nr:hypothetical protein [Gemmatimonadaceae bacterium]
MARAISMRHTNVLPPDRGAFRERARRLRSHYEGAGCHYWVFEEESLAGAYVEFFEANDVGTLNTAHRGAPAGQVDAARTYIEVELS